jgi:hypothetical protein
MVYGLWFIELNMNFIKITFHTSMSNR